MCSVDPPGCTDIDDALHCRELGNGNVEVLRLSLLLANVIQFCGSLFFDPRQTKSIAGKTYSYMSGLN